MFTHHPRNISTTYVSETGVHKHHWHKLRRGAFYVPRILHLNVQCNLHRLAIPLLHNQPFKLRRVEYCTFLASSTYLCNAFHTTSTSPRFKIALPSSVTIKRYVPTNPPILPTGALSSPSSSVSGTLGTLASFCSLFLDLFGRPPDHKSFRFSRSSCLILNS